MTAQPRDPLGRFSRAQDAARIATAAPHVDPVKPPHGHVARGYQMLPELRMQQEIDATLKRSPWGREPYDRRDWEPTPNKAFGVLLFLLGLLTLGCIAVFIGSLL